MTQELDTIQTVDTSPFKHLVMTIGELPSSFVDSMTYYELLAWLCNYLQATVIPTVNNNADAVTELQQLYTELESYVDDYFDNLDVQEEIDNKLDEMSRDGSLTAIIKNYVDPIQQEFETTITNQQNQYETNLTESVNTSITSQNSRINTIENLVNNAVNATPTVVSSVDDMTDTSKIYLLTSDGYWYYYDGEDWTQGGVYQATGIDRLSIIGALIASNTITKDKLNDKINLLSKATEVRTHSFVSGYNTASGPNFGINETTNVLIFDLSDLETNKMISYKIDGNTSAGGANLRYSFYKSSDYTSHIEMTNAQISGNSRVYDSSTGRGFININEYSTYDTLAITVNNNFDIVYENSFSVPSLIAGDKIKIDATDLRTNTNVTNGVQLQGYDVSTYLPLIRSDYRFNCITLSLTSENLSKIGAAQLFIENDSLGVNNRIILYKENTRVKLISLSEIINSDFYNSTTKRAEIGKIIGDYLYGGYDYIKIFYRTNISEVPIFTTFVGEDNVNYNLLNKNSSTEIIIPPKVKMVENQNMSFYFQNFFRYTNIDLLQNKRITNAFHCDNRMAVFNNANAATLNCAVITKDNMESNVYNINVPFEMEVVASDAGNGQTKKVLMIGDSLTNAGNYTQRLLDLFNDDVMNIELLGTQTKYSNSNRFEGKSGWSIHDYVTDSHYNGFSNPFYDSDSGTFNFTYYMTNQNYTGVDYVFINLGTNDLNHTDSDIITELNTIINSILSYDSNIKIGLWLPPCRGLTETVDQSNLIETFLALRINKLFINTYKNNPNVNLIPVYLNVNPYRDYPTLTLPISDTNSYSFTYCSDKVHTNMDGYYHIGDVLYAWIKFFAS